MKGKWIVAGLLILAELGLCAAIILILWTSIGLVRVSGLRWRLFQADSVSAQADEEQRFSVHAPAKLSVENSSGKITLTGGSGAEIAIVAHKTTWGPTQADAEAALTALKVSVTQTGDAVTVRVERPEDMTLFGGANRADTVDFTITVPSQTAVTAHTGSGAVAVSGLTGGVDVDLHSSFGDVTLDESQAGEVEAGSNAGTVSLEGVLADGQATLTSDFGAIRYKEGSASALTASTSSGEVRLTGLTVSGAVTAKSDFGSVTLEQVEAASYDLSTNSGAVSLAGARGEIKAHSDFGDVEVTGAEEAELDLSTNSGSIRFTGSLGEGPHVLETDFGSVRLSLPADVALEVDLKTDFGTVKSEYPITLQGEPDQSHWRGTINGGGAQLRASTNSGDISLEILNS